MTDRAKIIAARRERLTGWIRDRYKGKQADYIKASGLNQGMVSDLQKTKSFGEEVAANIEAKSPGMPAGYLVNPFADASPSHAAREPDSVRKVEDVAAASALALQVLFREISAIQPTLGKALSVALAALQGESATQRQELAVLRAAAAAGLQSAAREALAAAPLESSGKQSRRGR